MVKNMNTPALTPEEKMQKDLSSIIEECDVLEIAANLTDALVIGDLSHEQKRDLSEVIKFLHSVARVQLDPESRKKHEAAA